MLVACVYFAHFPIALEQRRNAISSDLVLLGESTIFDCSPLAEKRGVTIGMRVSEAVAICPNAVTLELDIPYYKFFAETILDSLEQFSPIVEPAELGIAYLLLDGLPYEPEEYARGIITQLAERYGFIPSVGI